MKPNKDTNLQGKTFAEIAAKVNQRYAKRLDPISQQTQAMEYQNLMRRNDIERQMQQATNGPSEPIQEFEGGGPLWDSFRNIFQTGLDVSKSNMESYRNIGNETRNTVSPPGMGAIPTTAFPQGGNQPQSIMRGLGNMTGSGNTGGLGGDFTNGDLIQMGAHALPAIYNLARGAFTKAQEVEPEYNHGYDTALNRAKKMRINSKAMINRDEAATQVTRKALRDNSRGFNNYIANLQNVQGQQASRFADIQHKTDLANNQIDMYVNQLETQRGQDRRDADRLARQEYTQNQAAKQGFVAQGISQLSNSGVQLGKGHNTTRMNEMLIKLLNQRSSEFEMNNEGDVKGK